VNKKKRECPKDKCWDKEEDKRINESYSKGMSVYRKGGIEKIK